MIEANVRQAKAKLSSYLARVEQREEVVILRRGKPVAVLKPLEAVVRLLRFKEPRRQVKLTGLAVSQICCGRLFTNRQGLLNNAGREPAPQVAPLPYVGSGSPGFQVSDGQSYLKGERAECCRAGITSELHLGRTC